MLEYVVDNEAEESNGEGSNGRECGGYRCKKKDGSDEVIGKWGVGLSEVQLQSCDVKEKLLLEHWS